jgi:hypothetical protein
MEAWGSRKQKTGFSPAAGLKNGRFDRERNSEKENIECPSKVFRLFYKK